MKKLIYFGLVLILFFSCNRSKEDNVVSLNNCDCKGAYSIVLKDTLAKITQSKTLFIKGSSTSVFKELMACDIAKVSNLDTSPDSSFNYRVSGGIRPPCVANGVAYFWTIDITSIKAIAR